MRHSRIKGLGHFVPERVVTNHELSKLMDTSDEWIVERTGIRERRYVSEGVGTADLALEASKMALDDAGMTAEEIDFIVFATLSPDYFTPGSGCLLQEKLDIAKRGIGALDIRNQCTGFIYGLSISDQFIKSGMYNTILLVGSEIHSTGLDLTTRGRDVGVIFGDGAGAAVITVSEDENRSILSTHLHADGRYAKDLWIEGPASIEHPRISKKMLKQNRHFPYMNGKKVFKHAVIKFPAVIKEALEANGFGIDDINLLIPHQANLRITEAIAHSLGVSNDKVFSNIQKYGNTTAASIPIALSEAYQEGKISKNDIICLAAFGSGFTWSSALIRW